MQHFKQIPSLVQAEFNGKNHTSAIGHEPNVLLITCASFGTSQTTGT